MAPKLKPSSKILNKNLSDISEIISNNILIDFDPYPKS